MGRSGWGGGSEGQQLVRKIPMVGLHCQVKEMMVYLNGPQYRDHVRLAAKYLVACIFVHYFRIAGHAIPAIPLGQNDYIT